jgi:hypothetical protein
MQSIGYRIPFSLMISARLLIAAPTSDQEAANKLGRCYEPERPFCTLARFQAGQINVHTYLSAQVGGGETPVHAGRCHAERSIKVCDNAEGIKERAWSEKAFV